MRAAGCFTVGYCKAMTGHGRPAETSAAAIVKRCCWLCIFTGCWRIVFYPFSMVLCTYIVCVLQDFNSHVSFDDERVFEELYSLPPFFTSRIERIDRDELTDPTVNHQSSYHIRWVILMSVSLSNVYVYDLKMRFTFSRFGFVSRNVYTTAAAACVLLLLSFSTKWRSEELLLLFFFLIIF